MTGESQKHHVRRGKHPCLAALLVFVLITGVAAVLIWLLISPRHVVAGSIHVAPVLENILTGEPASQIADYEKFVNTQARVATGTRVVHRVADDRTIQSIDLSRVTATEGAKIRRMFSLSDPNSGIGKNDPVAMLQAAIRNKVIYAAPLRNTEYMSLVMKSRNAGEARRIVDAFIRHYISVHETEHTEGATRELQTLENREALLEGRLGDYRSQINQLAQRFGTKDLDGRHDMKLQRVDSLLAELGKLQARRINLEIRVKVLENMDMNEPTVDPGEMVQMRQQFVANDALVKELAGEVAQIERELAEAAQQQSSDNPESKRLQAAVATMRERLADAQERARNAFDAEAGKKRVGELELARRELEEVAQYEQSLRETLSEEDTETINVGRIQLMIQDLEEQYALTKELYDAMRRRIEVMKLQQQRPGRISVAEYAKITDVEDSRPGLTAIAAGVGLIFALITYIRRRRRMKAG